MKNQTTIFYLLPIILVTALGGFFIYFINLTYEPASAGIRFIPAPNFTSADSAVSNTLDNTVAVDCACEKRFNKEYPIVWNGRVVSTFESGVDIGIQRYNNNTKYDQFYVDAANMYKGEPGKDVQVMGRLVGITCAYANTVFGECVPEVEADKISLLN